MQKWWMQLHGFSVPDCVSPKVNDSCASYLRCVLDSIHSVLGAVIIRGTPVQVELAEPVGSTERTTPQHCDSEKMVQQ